MIIRLAVSVILFALSSPAWAERFDEMVLLVNMVYSHGQWGAKPVELLPCGGPSKPDSIAATRSMYQIKNAEGKVLMRHYIQNPRLILVEDPREQAALLKEIQFNLRIPIQQMGKSAIPLNETLTFEFFESGAELKDLSPQKEPSVSMKMEKGLSEFLRMQSRDKRSPCAIAHPNMDELRPLTMKPGTALSPESLASLIKRDPSLVIRWGLDNNVQPSQLKRLITSNPKVLDQLKIDRLTADRVLKEYDNAYKNRRPGRSIKD